MLKRLLLGLVKGGLVGGAFALLMIHGFGLNAFGALLAYILAMVVGVVTGLVAGKPIWAKDARIEAGLKAVAGAVVGALLMLALRSWANISLDLGAYGNGVIGELPIVALPTVATLLALFYEVDNTGATAAQAEEKEKDKPERARIAEGAAGSSLADELLEDDAAEERARRTR
jgi:hypothetical protein